MQNKDMRAEERNVFLEALRQQEHPEEIWEEETALEEEAPEAAAPEDVASEDFMEDAVVPAGKPDSVGKTVLGIDRVIRKLLRPFGKAANLFLAPLLKPFRKGADRVTGRDWALFLSLIVITAVAVTAPMAVVKLQSTHKDAGLYAPVLGQLYSWEKGTFQTDEEGVTFFTPEGEESLNMTGIPFYYADRPELLWTSGGVWYSVEKDMARGKVERFSTVEQDSGRVSRIRTADDTVFEKGGFLYDNADTYVFLENVTLCYNGNEVTLPPLSYVEVRTGMNIDYYPYGGEVVSEVLSTEAEALFENGARVDLSGDIMYYYNGTLRLIYCALDKLAFIEE